MVSYFSGKKSFKHSRRGKRFPILMHVSPVNSDLSLKQPVPRFKNRKSKRGKKRTAKHLSHIGLLVPAVAVVPTINSGVEDTSNQEFRGLPGEDRSLVLAAAHIEDAQTGRGEFGKAQYYFKPRHAQIAFKIFTNPWFLRLIYLTTIVHSALTFLEPPSIPPGQLRFTIPSALLNFLCLLLYLIDIILQLKFLTWKTFWTREEFFWNRVEFVLFCGFTVDWILLVIQFITRIRLIVQPFRMLRLVMVMCKAKNVGHIYNVVQSIVFKLGGIVLVILIFIFIYGCIGIHLVMEPFEVIVEVNISALRPERMADVSNVLSDVSNKLTSDEISEIATTCTENSRTVFNESNIYEGTFNHIGLGALQLFILLTTENYPVFMFPAYKESPWFFAYFGSFIFIGVFLLTAVLLAIIANIYWQYNKKFVKKERTKQRAELVKAWKLLDTSNEERICVDDPQLLKLFHILKPKNTDEENKELIEELDPYETGYVDWIEWVTQILNILDLEKTTVHKPYPGNCFAQQWLVCLVLAIRRIIGYKALEIAVTLMIICHSILFALRWRGMPFIAEITIHGLRTAVVSIFVLQILLKIVAFGNFFFKSYNFMDLILVVIGFISNLIWYVSLSENVDINVELWRGSTVVISSMAIFFRIFFNSTKSRTVMNIFFRLFPIMWDLIVLFAVVMYFYAVIGMEAFSRFEISTDTPSSDYFQYNCGLGFMNFPCSLIIVFQLLITSNWHEIMNSIILSTKSQAPLIYFITFYIVINLIIMNLLIAIGIEALNKFSLESIQEMAEEEEANQQMRVKEKITGRLILKGMVSGLIDAFSSSSTNELGVVDSAKADDQEEKEETSEQQRRRNVVSAPARKLGRNTAQISQVKFAKRHSSGELLEPEIIVVPESSPPLHGAFPPLKTQTPPSNRKQSLSPESAERSANTSPGHVTAADNSESEAIESAFTSQQGMLRKKIKERQRNKIAHKQSHDTVVSTTLAHTAPSTSKKEIKVKLSPVAEISNDINSNPISPQEIVLEAITVAPRGKTMAPTGRASPLGAMVPTGRVSPLGAVASTSRAVSPGAASTTSKGSLSAVTPTSRASSLGAVVPKTRASSLGAVVPAGRVSPGAASTASKGLLLTPTSRPSSLGTALALTGRASLLGATLAPPTGRLSVGNSDEESDQFDVDEVYEKTRRRSSFNNPGSKFRKGHNTKNWGSELQEITIINKEEISELRKQLNANKLNPKRKNLPRNSTTDSRRSSFGSVNYFGRQGSQSSAAGESLHEDMGSRWSSYESLTSEKRDDIFITSPESDASSRPVPRPGKNSLNAPLIAVEEAPSECPNNLISPVEPEKLMVPGGSSATRASRQKRKSSDGGGEIPEWLVSLTQKYNVALTKSSSSTSIAN